MTGSGYPLWLHGARAEDERFWSAIPREKTVKTLKNDRWLQALADLFDFHYHLTLGRGPDIYEPLYLARGQLDASELGSAISFFGLLLDSASADLQLCCSR